MTDMFFCCILAVILLLLIFSAVLNIRDKRIMADILSEKGIQKIRKTSYDRLIARRYKIRNCSTFAGRGGVRVAPEKREVPLINYPIHVEGAVQEEGCIVCLYGIKGKKEFLLFTYSGNDMNFVKQIAAAVEKYNGEKGGR